MAEILQPTPKTAPKPGSWASTNYIQRFGIIGSLVLYAVSLFLSFSNLRLGLILGLCGWSCLLFGYVAGSLWRVRHALHFWWSLAFSAVVHACLLPVYVHLVRNDFQPHASKVYFYLSAYLVVAETLFLIFLLKRVAMWIHRRYSTQTSLGRLEPKAGR